VFEGVSTSGYHDEPMQFRAAARGQRVRGIVLGCVGAFAISGFLPRAAWSQATLCASPKPRRDGCSSFVFFNAIGAVGIVRGTHLPLNTQTDDDLPSYGGASLGYMHAR